MYTRSHLEQPNWPGNLSGRGKSEGLTVITPMLLLHISVGIAHPLSQVCARICALLFSFHSYSGKKQILASTIEQDSKANNGCMDIRAYCILHIGISLQPTVHINKFVRPRWPYDMRPCACRKVHVCHCNSLGGVTWRSITGRTDRRATQYAAPS